MSGGRFAIPDGDDNDDDGFALDGELDGELPRILREPTRGLAAGGRIEPGRVTYDDVRQEHLATDPRDVRDRHRPPGEWTATDQEIETVVDWTNARISAQERVRQDNSRKFLEVYAAERGKEVSRLQTGTASRPGAFRREEESSLRWMQSGPQVLERGESAPSLGGGPSPVPRGVEIPDILGPVRAAPLPGESQEQARDRVEMLRRQAAQERENERMAERMRLTRISGWLERPEILGVQGLSSEVYGFVEKAYVYLKDNMPQFASLENMDVIPNSDEISVRNLFAQLAANYANHKDFLVSPITALDRTGDRLLIERGEILRRLNEWGYDATRGEFWRRDPDEMRREVEGGMALPPLRAGRY